MTAWLLKEINFMSKRSILFWYLSNMLNVRTFVAFASFYVGYISWWIVPCSHLYICI